MGKITALRASGQFEFCVVGDHAYVRLSHADLVEVVDGLHRSGGLALEQRLRSVLRGMPVARNEVASARPRIIPDHGRFSGT